MKLSEIKQARLNAGLTQKEAGKVVYAAENTWSQWELGKRKMSTVNWEHFNIKTRKVANIDNLIKNLKYINDDVNTGFECIDDAIDFLRGIRPKIIRLKDLECRNVIFFHEIERLEIKHNRLMISILKNTEREDASILNWHVYMGVFKTGPAEAKDECRLLGLNPYANNCNNIQPKGGQK